MVICEGVTGQRFCHMVLSPYVASWCIGIETPLIKRSHGGLALGRYFGGILVYA